MEVLHLHNYFHFLKEEKRNKNGGELEKEERNKEKKVTMGLILSMNWELLLGFYKNCLK